MNYLDIAILVLVLLFGLKGLRSGLVREFFGILGLIGGLYLAVKFKAEAGAWISTTIYDINRIGVLSGDGTEIIVGFLGVLFGVWIVCLILGEIFAKLLKASGLGIVDKIGGFGFGALKVFLIFAVFAVLIRSSAFLNEQTKPYFQNSIVYPYLLKYGEIIMQIDSSTIKTSVENVIGEDKNITPEKSVVLNNLNEANLADDNSSANLDINQTLNLDENATLNLDNNITL